MNPLSQLRDIHVNSGFGFWSIAIGWYLLIIVTLLLLLSVGYVWRRRQQRLKPKHDAQKHLARLKKHYQRECDLVEVAVELSILLRRAALARFPNRDVAALKNEQWLSFLDEKGDTNQFSRGVGRILISAPYQRQSTYAAEELFVLVEQWITKNLARGVRV
ncbi:MAG: DUF4381 domain-containing protein [Coxiellaceae bacterium]|nr:DUF4381 domain-containing protein [Coxiellaceae bacterium]